MSYPCPICGELAITDYEDNIEGTQCEYKEHCPNNCTEYEYHFGSFMERIGERVWEWHYTETEEDERKRRNERIDEISRLKLLR